MSETTALTIAPQRSIDSESNLHVIILNWHSHLDLLVKTGELSDASRQTYQEGARRFMDWCTARAVTDEIIREWLADMRGAGFKPSTVNTWLSGLRAYFTWAVGARRLPYNPCAGIKGLKRTDSRTHKRDILSDVEIRCVLALPAETPGGKRDRAILHLMAYTAARTIEVHRADLSDLQTESGRMVLRVQGKGHDEADDVIVVAHPNAELAMQDWLAIRGAAAGPLFTSLSPRTRDERIALSSIRGIVKGYYKLAGIRNARKTTHSLRHTAISNSLQHGASLQKAKSMARHRSIDTTLIYVHETDRITQPAEQFINYGE